MADRREETSSSDLLQSSTASAGAAGGYIRDVSDELTQFAPFEASKTVSLPYRGEPRKPPQVEINDGSYLGQPKVLFRKLRQGNPSGSGSGGPGGSKSGPRVSPDPELSRSAGGRGAGGKRVRVQVVGSGRHEERGGGRRGGGRVVDPESGRVTKSLVLNRIGTLGKDQDSKQDLKRYWMPDSACKECSECGTKFNIIVRRHHCRICGRIFCNSCCSLTIPAMKLRPDLQGNLRVCKECLEIFQEFQTIKRPEGPGLTSNPTSTGAKPPLSSAASSSPSSATTPVSSSGVAAKIRSVSNSFQKNVVPGGGEGGGGGGGGSGGGGSGGGGDTLTIRRTGSGSHTRAGPRQSVTTVMSPHKSWDDASSGRSQDDPPSGLARMNVGFDNPTSLRPKENFESLDERDERLMALHEDEVEYVITEVWFQLISPASGITPQNHRYRLRTFPNTFSASGIITWLLRTGHASNRVVAVAMGQALVDTKRLQVVSSLDNQFKDEPNLFLEFGQAADMGSEQLVESPPDLDAPTWFQRLAENEDSEVEQSHRPDENLLSVRYRGKGSFMNSLQPTITISSMSELTGVADSGSTRPTDKEKYVVVNSEKMGIVGGHQSPGSSTELKLSLHGDEHSVSPGPSTPPPSLPMHFDPISPNFNASFTVVSDRDIIKALPVGGLSAAADTAQDLEVENGKDVKSNEEARAVFEQERTFHFDSIMIQLIKSYGISLGWLKVIKPLVKEAARKVKTNVYSTDTMAIKHYVKVKKIPGGRRADSTLVNGVVCTKNITHKKMKISIRNPTILLLKCAFEFQRKENQLSSFDTLQMQEEKYLKNLVARVKTFQPRVILVQKSVARLALEMFFHLDIVVAVNVKPSVMERVARSTQGDLLHSLDQLFFNVQLGSCGHFHVRDFVLPDGVKKTLMYFNHCDPRLGCTITLMGGSRRELKKVKKATLFGVFIAYNSQLETSFLIDEFAWPTAPATDELQLLPDTEDYSSTASTPEWPLHPSVSYPVEGIAPAELTRKLKALVPEYKAELEQRESSSRSTPTTGRSGLGSQSSNASPLLPNARSHSMSRIRSGSLASATVAGTPPDEQNDTLRPAPATSQSVDDVRSRSDPHIAPSPPAPDAATLSVLGRREFEKVLDQQILSISPGVKLPVPYLQTPEGFAADVRNYLPSVIYWSYQFLAAVQISQKTEKKSAPSSSSDTLEMGITAKTATGAVSKEEPLPSSPQKTPSGTQSSRSYRSISEHPFTSSIFLLKANTNEMKAALADYRANSGVTNPSHEFFFPTAYRASDYRQQLQNIFNRYQQFELSVCRGRDGGRGEVADGREESCESVEGGVEGTRGSGLDSGSLEVSDEMGSRTEKKLRRRTRRHTTPSFTGSGTKEELAVSCDGEGAVAVEVMAVTLSEGQDQQEEDETQKVLAELHERHKERRESTPMKTLGTLEDIDRDYSKLATQAPDDELLDLHGNEDKATPLPVHSDHFTAMFPPYQVDCMDPIKHQSISILFSSTCHDGQRHQLPCVPPCVIQMQYYGHNDISLGDFLKRYCFRPDYRCQTCGSEMTKHQRHIIHGPAALHISVQQLDIPIPNSNDGIFTWLACKHCTLCTPYIKMADSSLLFSFAKFLELKFHCDQFVTRLHSSKTNETSCQHSLHKHYLHYFSFRNKIACFQPAEISILELRIPPTVIVINTPHSEYHHNFSREIKHIEHITEGVSYRIKQRLQYYNMEPVTAHVKDSIASSKGERDAFRGRIKLLKEKVVQGGFLESGGEEMNEETQEAEFAALQDGIAEIKRALTEFVSCWNIELETLDSKIRVFHSRREAGVSRNSDRDSPFTPMAAEIPHSRGATPRLLPRPDQEDNLLLNTPLSSPPDSPREDSKIHGASLNREAGDVARLTVADAGLTPDSQTEVGEEVKASGDTRSTQDSSSQCPYDTEKNFSSTSDDRIVSSSEDLLTFDSRISSNSLSGEGGGGGGKGGEREEIGKVATAVVPAKETTATSVEANHTKTRPKGGKKSEGGSNDNREAITSSGRRRADALLPGSTLQDSGKHQPAASNAKEPTKMEAELEQERGPGEGAVDTQLEERGTSTNVTPTIIVSEDELGYGEGDGWWSERGSPLSGVCGSDSPFKSDTTTDSEGRTSYQSVRTLIVAGPGQQKLVNQVPPGEESQPDGVGLFNRFRGTKDAEVREDPNKFYLVDPADMSTTNSTPTQRSPETAHSHHHGHHHGPRPHKRQGNPSSRKNGSSSAPPPSDADGRASSRGVREKERSVPIRPFQKLPPPFDLNEHHNMHKSLKIPIAIYEKEPTSLIAYALSSREYAQEYWALVERRPVAIQPPEKLLSQPSSPKVPKKQVDPPLVQLPPPTKTSALKQAYQELRKKGPLNAMNVFSGMSVASDRPEPHDKSGDESRRIEAALSSKSSHSSSSTPSKSSQTNSSSFPATDQSALQEDGDGFRWNTTGEQPSTGSSSKGGHISLEFTAPDRTSSIFCKVYFAEEFQHLRELVFPSGEDRFIRSLSRCVKFDAKGGKSRSTFCKVIDDRFIMKQIKPVEISSFEQIAPLYFDHITRALESKRPLALAKIIGVYTIGYRNTRTGNSKRLDVIVMENLLYGRKSSKVFDLKGSMRSRYIDPSKDSSNDVLLDENFLNHICYSPVYVYPHSKAALMRAIEEDTRFLAENAIMDYSLLTCIDDQTGELVVGIIDYVRTFTLDKRLEMYIKKTAGRVLPTVVYPELYRKRFCEAIDRYFTVVPDKWTGLGTGF